MEDVKYPQFINIDSDIKAKYLDPLKESVPMFANVELTDVYFFAAALGFKHKIKVEPGKKIANIRLYSSLVSKYKSLIRIIALADSNYDYEILGDGKKMLKIVESYANGGASLLYDKILGGKGLDFSIEDEIWDEIKK